jgi:hypothetical protein
VVKLRSTAKVDSVLVDAARPNRGLKPGITKEEQRFAPNPNLTENASQQSTYCGHGSQGKRNPTREEEGRGWITGEADVDDEGAALVGRVLGAGDGAGEVADGGAVAQSDGDAGDLAAAVALRQLLLHTRHVHHRRCRRADNAMGIGKDGRRRRECSRGRCRSSALVLVVKTIITGFEKSVGFCGKLTDLVKSEFGDGHFPSTLLINRPKTGSKIGSGEGRFLLYHRFFKATPKIRQI